MTRAGLLSGLEAQLLVRVLAVAAGAMLGSPTTTHAQQNQSSAAALDVRFGVTAPMRDGVILRANIFRPAGDGPYPVALTRTPYGKEFALNLANKRLAKLKANLTPRRQFKMFGIGRDHGPHRSFVGQFRPPGT